MLPVFMLFLIPVGGGIPAGVLLAKQRAIAWPVAAFLYFVSDVVLAIVFEPVLRLLVKLGGKSEFVSRVGAAMTESMHKAAALYGGAGAGPFTLILVAFGVDPMTGRAAALAAGHGFVAGWAIAIAGDMLYYGVIAFSTLKLSGYFNDPNTTMFIVLAGMIFIPMLVRRLKVAYSRP